MKLNGAGKSCKVLKLQKFEVQSANHMQEANQNSGDKIMRSVLEEVW